MTNSQRITFMGTPNLAVPYLKSLIQNDFNIVAVYTQPPRAKDRGMNIRSSPIHNIAKINQIPCFTPLSLNNYEEIKKFENLKNDLVIVMGYGILLPQDFLVKPSFGCINIHLSLLPKWRGASPVEYSLLNGEKETGVTIFKLTKKLDAGPILASQKSIVHELMTKINLQTELNDIGIKLLIKSLPKFFLGTIQPVPQDDNLATYAPKIKSFDTKINFDTNAIEIFNKVRAFSPKPGAWFVLNNERIKILSCLVKSMKGKMSTILTKDFLLGCKDYSIKPILIQREGKKCMNIEDFLKGFSFKIGDRINSHAKI